jgi:hypothetical protein
VVPVSSIRIGPFWCYYVFITNPVGHAKTVCSYYQRMCRVLSLLMIFGALSLSAQDADTCLADAGTLRWLNRPSSLPGEWLFNCGNPEYRLRIG